MFEFISRDDVFVLGNLAGLAVHNRSTSPIGAILNVLQLAEPENAAAYTLAAKKCLDEGNIKSGIQLLENSPAFEAKENRESAIMLHLILLQFDRQFDRALDLAYAYRSERIVVDERNVQLVEKAIKDLEFLLSHFQNEQMVEEDVQCL